MLDAAQSMRPYQGIEQADDQRRQQGRAIALYLYTAEYCGNQEQRTSAEQPFQHEFHGCQHNAQAKKKGREGP